MNNTNQNSPSCPLCNSYNIKKRIAFISPEKAQTEFSVGMCLSCKHSFTFPQPEDTILSKFYSSDFFTKQLLDTADNPDIQKLLKHRWELIRRFVEKGIAVDIGCGIGSFLNVGRAYGFEAVGIEESQPLADYGRKKYSLKVFSENFETGDFSSLKADVVTLWDVFEHLKDPSRALGSISKMLKNGGILTIGVPNAASIERYLFGGSWIGWWMPLHLQHYTSDILSKLLQKNGFHLLHIEYVDSYYMFDESMQILLGKDNSEIGAFMPREKGIYKILRRFICSRRFGNITRKIIRTLYKFGRRIFPEKSSYFIIIAKRNIK